jgi:uncharacterized protein YceK
MIKYIGMYAASLLLIGCSSVGTLNQTVQHVYNTEIITIKEKQDVSHCPVYKPLPTSAIPELPLMKVRHAADNNEREVVVILTKYIRDLREYIAKEKKEELLHHKKYLDSCSTEVK